MTTRSFVLAALVLGLAPVTGVQAETLSNPGIDAGAHLLHSGRAKTLELLKAKRAVWRDASRQAPAACEDNPRPTYNNEQTIDDDDYGFRIHYTTDSSDDRSVTDAQAQRTAEVMREVIDAEGVGGLGYNMPPDDLVDAELWCDEGFGGHGGNGYYDVYFVAEDNIYGYAQPLTLTGSMNATSFLALSTWILDYNGALEVTVAHEFFHAIQFNIDVYEAAYWFENTATWMEEIVYDDINDYYNYLPKVFEKPELPVTTEQIYMYGFSVWPLYMTEALGNDAIMEIWDVCAESSNEGALEAQKTVLDALYDGGWAGAIADFRGAMYDRAQFSEGADYPSVSVSELVSAYPAEGGLDLRYTGAEIVVFPSTSAGVTDDTLSVCFKGGSDGAVVRFFAREASSRDIVALSVVGTDNDGCVEVQNFGATYDQAALVATYAALSGSSNFTYSACLGGDDSCEAAEPGSTPTPGDDDGGGDGYDDGEGEVVLCGGCIVLEEDPDSRQSANLLFFGFQLFAGIFLLRRRP